MLKEFREFVLRGNVIDLAVAVVVGAAFTAIITSFVDNIINPIIASIGGEPDFSAYTIGAIQIGNFINSVIAFLITALVLFFIFVKPVNAMMARFHPAETAIATAQCPVCLTEIPVGAKRCPNCTTVLLPEPEIPV
ncbi:MAG: large conductance mechanosensitive channel protein MscL [Thermomicrobiales bacterium]|nr:large conductance mechanosensitive channel protein MscL [Thermomicrobiales bacterium]